jgi:hypothetical protein
MGSCVSSPEEPSQITSTGGTVYVSTGKSASQLNGSNDPNGNNNNNNRSNKTNKSEGGGSHLPSSSSNNKEDGNYPNTPMTETKRAQRERSYAIDKQIEEDSKRYRKECKILLLGE